MLTDFQSRALKATRKICKISDQRGLYAAVTPPGAVGFRYDYRVNGRRKTLVIASYRRKASDGGACSSPPLPEGRCEGILPFNDSATPKLKVSRQDKHRIESALLAISQRQCAAMRGRNTSCNRQTKA